MTDHYKTGLRTPVRVGGAIRIGAMTNADYSNQARQVFAGMGADYALILTSASGQMTNHPFPTKAELDDAYGLATGNPAEAVPGGAAYVAMFDRKTYAGTSTPDPLLEEAFFATPPPPKPEGNIGAAVAIGLAGVAGLVVTGGKKKR